jgi:hypothetical protein
MSTDTTCWRRSFAKRASAIACSTTRSCTSRIGRSHRSCADESDSRLLHEKLDHYARRVCPAIESLGVAYQWNLAQIEYATDIVFRRREDLAPIDETLVRTAVHSVKAAHIATFLGRRLQQLRGDWQRLRHAHPGHTR